MVIEAFRFQIDGLAPDWFMDRVTANEIITVKDGTCLIKTLEGDLLANKGDYIILTMDGEVYPCRPSIFEKTYKEVKQYVRKY